MDSNTTIIIVTIIVFTSWVVDTKVPHDDNYGNPTDKYSGIWLKYHYIYHRNTELHSNIWT